MVVKLFGDLRKYLPPRQERLEVEIEGKATASEIIQRLAIDEGEVWRISIGGKLIEDLGEEIPEGAEVLLFPPIGGGGSPVGASAPLPLTGTCNPTASCGSVYSGLR